MGAIDARTVLVTGATDGLGRALAADLARAGAVVLVHGRSPERVERTVAELASEATEHPHGYVADFADLAQVARLAEELTRDHDRLHVLVNNAGIGAGPPGGARETSADGHELRLQVNFLAPFLLTRLLLPLLRAGAPARIVHVASGAQQTIDLDDLMLERGYDGWRAYGQSKLAMVADAFDLAEQLDPSEVTVNALHPASQMDTKMVRESVGRAQRPLDEGVAAVWHLVTSPELAGITGRYFSGQREARAAAQAYDRTVRAALMRRARHITDLDG